MNANLVFWTTSNAMQENKQRRYSKRDDIEDLKEQLASLELFISNALKKLEQNTNERLDDIESSIKDINVKIYNLSSETNKNILKFNSNLEYWCNRLNTDISKMQLNSKDINKDIIDLKRQSIQIKNALKHIYVNGQKAINLIQYQKDYNNHSNIDDIKSASNRYENNYHDINKDHQTNVDNMRKIESINEVKPLKQRIIHNDRDLLSNEEDEIIKNEEVEKRAIEELSDIEYNNDIIRKREEMNDMVNPQQIANIKNISDTDENRQQ